MFWHQSRLKFSEAAKEQEPTAGYRPGRSITLVRNPSWVACRCDDLRPAYVDELHFGIGGDPETITAEIGNDQLDIGPDSNYSVADTYATNPLQTGLHVYPTDTIRYLSFNLAVPPFDDIHVRKAVNFAIDKDGLRRLVGGPQAGPIATHAIPDGMETIAGRALLAGFDPYSTPYYAGDIDKARAEMSLSKYDSNRDGVCDAPICRGVLAFTSFNEPYAGQAALIQHGLRGLGITLEVRSCERCPLPFGESCRDPASHTAFCLNQAWTKDYPDAFGWWVLLDSSGLFPDCCNASLLGASPKFLRKYHYSVTSVPSVDADFDRCEPLAGDQRVRCLAELDRRLMTEIVPWVPYLFDNRVTMISSRMRNFTWDAFTGTASLDHLAIHSASPTG
jgi:peptide/nickel transport system substrate-binding protein